MKLNSAIDTMKIKAQFIKSDKAVIPTKKGSVELKNGNKEIWIECIPETSQLDSATLKITFEERSNIRAEDDALIVLTVNFVEIKPISYYKPTSEKTLISISDKIAKAAYIITLIATLFSVSSALALIKLTQMLDFLLLLNVEHPSNLTSFLEPISSNVFDQFPNLVSALTDDTCQVALDRFIEEEVSCQVFDNLGSYVIFLVLAFFAFLILYCLSFIFKKSSFGGLCSRWSSSVSGGFWVEVFEGIQLDIFMSFFLSLRSIGKGSWTNKINSVLAAMLVFGWVIFNFFFMVAILKDYKSKQNRVTSIGEKNINKKKSIYEKVLFLKEDFNSETFFQRNFRPFNNFKDIAVSFCLVIFHNIPLLQIGLINVIQVVMTSLSIAYRPIRDTKNHIVETTKASIYSVCCFMMLIIKIFGGKLSKEKVYFVLGYPSIFFICVLFAFSLGVATLESFMNLKKLIQEKLCKKKEITQSNKKEGSQQKIVQKGRKDGKITNNQGGRELEGSSQNDSGLSNLLQSNNHQRSPSKRRMNVPHPFDHQRRRGRRNHHRSHRIG